MFQEVEAAEAPLAAYVADLERACRERGVTFHFGIDVGRRPEGLAAFERLVIATGARYRFRLGTIVRTLLNTGAGRWPGFAQTLSAPRLRHWFYYRARLPDGEALRRLARPDQKVVVIGDARAAGKATEAIAAAFEAALLEGAPAAADAPAPLAMADDLR